LIDFLKDKVKYLKEPYRLRVHIGYILIITFALTARPSFNRLIVGSIGIFFAVFIRAWASGIVMKNEELAVEGPYSLCRNPLYVGNILIGYSFAVIQGSLWSVGVVTLYLLLFYPYTIKREADRMRDLFGEEYEDYGEQVPVLIPRLTPYETLSGWNFKQYFFENKDFVNESLVLIFWGYTVYLSFS